MQRLSGRPPMKLYSKENKRIVDSFFADQDFRKHIEREIGPPVKMTVNWDKNSILVQGSFAGRELKISDILDAYPKGSTQ
jgi:hypothetical protein